MMNGIKAIVLLISMLITMPAAVFSGEINTKTLCEQAFPTNNSGSPEAEAHTEFLPLDNEICRTYGHEKGTYLGTYEDKTNIDSSKYCYYGVDVVTYLCQRCNVQFTDKQGEYYALHDREYSDTIECEGHFKCSSCGYEGEQ